MGEEAYNPLLTSTALLLLLLLLPLLLLLLKAVEAKVVKVKTA